MATIKQDYPAGEITFEISISSADPEFYALTVTGTKFQQGAGVRPANFSKEDVVVALSQPFFDYSSESKVGKILQDDGKGDARYSASFIRAYLEGSFGNPSFTATDEESLLGNFPSVATTAKLRIPKALEFGFEPTGMDVRLSQGENLINQIDDPLAEDYLEISNRSAAAQNLFTPWTASQRGGETRFWLPINFTQPLGLAAEEAFFNEATSIEPVLEDAQDEELKLRRLENKLTLNEQAILLFRIGKIMSLNKEKRENNKVYDRFACLDYRKNGKADPANVSNHITSTTDMGAIFEELRPIHLSAMIPRVRLFKRYTVDSMGEFIPDAADTKRTIVEYEFEEFPDASILNSTLGTSTGVGVSSFSWEFSGDNPYASERMVISKLQLRAQSIDAIDATRKSPTGKKYKFTDIFHPPVVETQIKDSKQQQISTQPRREYEAKIIVEYATDPKSEVWRNSKHLLKAVQNLRLELNLSINKYDLDLQPDGSILLNLDFIGRIDAASRDPLYANILPKASSLKMLGASSTILATRNVNLQTIAEKESRITRMRELQVKRQKWTTTQADEDKLTDKELNELRELETGMPLLSQEILALRREFRPQLSEKEYLEQISQEYDKVRLYQNILNGLITSDSIDVLKLNPMDITRDEDTSIMKNEECVPLSVQAAAENPTTKDVVTMDLTKKQFDKNKKEFMDRMKAAAFPMYSRDSYFIRYFYFGDLMQVVLEKMQGSNKDLETDIRTLLGPIEIVQNAITSNTFSSRVTFGKEGKIILEDSYGTRDVQVEKQYIEEQRQQINDINNARRGGDMQKILQAEKDRQVSTVLVNLADVPISLNLFLEWFSAKVANQGTYSYSINDFIKDSINSLIISALEADSTKLILPQQTRQLVLTSFEAAADVKAPDVFGFYHHDTDGLITDSPKSSILVEELLTNKAGKKSLPLFLAKNKPKSPDNFMADYLLVYAKSLDYLRICRTDADYRRDVAEGIYHLHSGKEAGIVKDIKLSANTFAEYESAMMIEGMNAGEPMVKRIYTASVTLNGAPVFRPGHIVFIKAAAYGTDNLLRDFGLMGYYSVVRASSNIAAGEYTTTLELQYQGSG